MTLEFDAEFIGVNFASDFRVFLNCVHWISILDSLGMSLENLVDLNIKARAVQRVWQSITGMALRAALILHAVYFLLVH